MLSRAPDIGRITSELVPAQFRPWVQNGLLNPLNANLGRIFALLNRGLSVQANLNAQLLTKTVLIPDDWLYVGDTGPDFATTWYNTTGVFTLLSFRKTDDGSLVVMRGCAQTDDNTKLTVTTLAAEYAPAEQEIFPSNCGNAYATFEVNASGTVVMRAGLSAGTYVAFTAAWTPADRRPVPASCWGASCEFPLQVRGPCLGVQLLMAIELGTSGKPNGLVVPGGGRPDWEERPAVDRRGRALRIRNQPGLAPGSRYQATWLAWGE